MKWLKKMTHFILVFAGKLTKDHVGAYAAQAAYFTVLSAIPLLMMLLALIQYTPLTKSVLLEMMSSVFPSVVMPLVVGIMEEIYTKSVTLVSVTAIVAFWSASKSMLSITTGFNVIFDVPETRNYFILRFRSAMHTLLLVVAIIFAALLIVFSENRLAYLGHEFPVVEVLLSNLSQVRFIVVIMVELLLFLFIYKFVPNRDVNMVWQIPGALFAAVGWSSFSYFFSLYIDKFSNMSYMYGSLTMVIIFMLWLYFCMYILLIGAAINSCVERYPRWRKWMHSPKEKKKAKKEHKRNKK